MDSEEARALARSVLDEWTLRSWHDLRAYIDQKVQTDLMSASKRRYTASVEIFWDEAPDERNASPPIRVVVCVDQAGARAEVPACVSRLVTPVAPLAIADALGKGQEPLAL